LQTNDSPKVSVIIPSYNTAQYIGETLDSVFAQTFDDFEVIVVNDGSPDTGELERVLGPYRDSIVYVTKKNGGLSSARNAGIRVARGQYVALLDSDDVWEPDYLAAQVAALDADPSAAVSYANAVIFGDGLDEGMNYMSVFRPEGEVTVQRIVAMKCNVLVSALVRRAALDRVGVFDEGLRTNEDFDLWLRIAREHRLANLPEPLLVYREVPGSISRTRAELLDRRAIAIAVENLQLLLADGPSETALRDLVALMRQSLHALSPRPDWRALDKLLRQARRRLAQRWPEDVVISPMEDGQPQAVLERARLKNSKLARWMLRMRDLAPRLGWSK